MSMTPHRLGDGGMEGLEGALTMEGATGTLRAASGTRMGVVVALSGAISTAGDTGTSSVTFWAKTVMKDCENIMDMIKKRGMDVVDDEDHGEA